MYKQKVGMKKVLSSRIANYVLLHGNYIKDIGLYHGKLGLSFTMFLYGRAYNCLQAERFATDLLFEVYDGININLPLNLEFGLAGIGLGVTYLNKLGFVECDLNEVLSDIDLQIMSYNPKRITDLSFRTGALGILEYVKTRLNISDTTTSIDKNFVQELEDSLYCRNALNTNFSIINSLTKPQWRKSQYLGHKLDLDGGSAYYLFKESYDLLLHNQ